MMETMLRLVGGPSGRYIPGLTENGKQKTPDWLAKLLGVEVPKEEATKGKTLKELVFTDGKEQ